MLETGSHALIQSSAAKPELNGRFVICKKLLEDRGSWKVVFPGGEHKPLAVKPANLKELPRHTFVLRSKEGPLANIPMPMSCTFDRDGHGGTGIRVHYADFWGDSYLQQVEAKTGGRGGPYENMGQYAAVTSPVSDADGKPADPQLCVIVRSKHEELYDCMAKYGIVEDTGARLTLGYHKDSRIVRIPYKYEDYGCPAPTRAQLDAYWKTQGVEVHRI